LGQKPKLARVAAEMKKGDWQKTDLGFFLERVAES
jgi:hypothetical protein